MDVYEQIQRDEGGSRLSPYFDCCGRFWSECECQVQGKLSIGVGRNLDDRGITATEGHLLYTHDVASAKADVNTRLGRFLLSMKLVMACSSTCASTWA